MRAAHLAALMLLLGAAAAAANSTAPIGTTPAPDSSDTSCDILGFSETIAICAVGGAALLIGILLGVIFACMCRRASVTPTQKGEGFDDDENEEQPLRERHRR